jgi:hypothetical protein
MAIILVIPLWQRRMSPDPSLPKRGKKWKSLLKRGREKPEITHSITLRTFQGG